MTPDVTAPLEVLRRAIRDGRPDDLPKLAAALSALTTEATLAAAGASRHGDDPDTYLTVPETAERLKVSSDWVYRRSLRLPFVFKAGGQLRISARGLDEWVSTQQKRKRT